MNQKPRFQRITVRRNRSSRWVTLDDKYIFRRPTSTFFKSWTIGTQSKTRTIPQRAKKQDAIRLEVRYKFSTKLAVFFKLKSRPRSSRSDTNVWVFKGGKICFQNYPFSFLIVRIVKTLLFEFRCVARTNTYFFSKDWTVLAIRMNTHKRDRNSGG